MRSEGRLLFTLLYIVLAAVWAQAEQAKCPMVELAVEKLPSMNIPRTAHSTLCLGDELVVIGGRTTGFVPTQTAEYFKDGEWHTMTMTYTHDDGFVSHVSSGEILVAGGHEKPLGIGQTFTIELYNPSEHTFRGYGCLDMKRAFARAVMLNDSMTIIAGNWYHKDTIECYDGTRQCRSIKPVSVPRSSPFMLRVGDDDMMIVGGWDNYGKPLERAVVDRVFGEPFEVPLLKEWHLLNVLGDMDCEYTRLDYKLPDDPEDMPPRRFAYLLPAHNDNGELGLIRVDSTEFTLMPTACPIPTESQFGHIEYYTPVYVDRGARRAYLVGLDKQRRFYVLAMEYDEQLSSPLHLTLYYTVPLPDCGRMLPVLTLDGDMVIAGGIIDNNYEPLNTVYRFKLGTQEQDSRSPLAWWISLAIAILLTAAVLFMLHRRHAVRPEDVTDVPTADDAAQTADNSQTIAFYNDIITRFDTLLEQQQIYLNSELKIGEVAAMLGVTTRDLSQSIATMRGYSFPQYVNRLRVEHAKQLLMSEPDNKLSIVAEQSGFSNETNFFRIFKAATGRTPREWLSDPDRK